MSWTLVVTSNGMRRVSHPAEHNLRGLWVTADVVLHLGQAGILPQRPSHQDEPLIFLATPGSLVNALARLVRGPMPTTTTSPGLAFTTLRRRSSP